MEVPQHRNTGGFRNQFIYQKALKLVARIMTVTDRFPKEEVFGLSSQIRRAAISVSSNIAEGYRRNSTREYLKFLSISYGSCGELQSQTDVALTMELITDDEHAELMAMEEEMSKLLWVTLGKLKEKDQGAGRKAQGLRRKG